MKTKEIIKNNLKWIILFICLILILAIVEKVLGQEINKLDIIGYGLISKYLISDNITPIAKAITQLGSAIFVIIVGIILSVAIKNKKIGIFIWINLAISVILNQGLKYIVQRPRPTEFRIIDERGYSFPSGHSMVSMAFYGLLIYLIYKKVRNKYLKYILTIILSLVIFLIGTSRIYLGVHYTSDVLAGFLISISYLIIFTHLIRNYIDEEK